MLTDADKARLLDLLERLVVALEALARARGEAPSPTAEPRHTP